MRTMYFDLGMGAAGDMLMAALVSLLDEEGQKGFMEKLNNAGIPGVHVELTDDAKCGIIGKHVHVYVHGRKEHVHDSAEHVHHHTKMEDIERIIYSLNVSDKVKRDVKSVYSMIAEAESLVHGVEVSEIHFHEVGMMDALCDITGCAMLMELLSPDKVIASPVNVGYGKVRCAHGILPVPAPATANLLCNVPCYSGRFEGEMCTPTGAALLKYYVDEFSNMPVLTMEKVGYGTGTGDFEAANVVRVILGRTDDSKDRIVEMRCNIDDITPEEISFALERIMDGGARDAFITSVVMKKNRPAYLLTVLCDEENKEKIAGLIFKHTTTIGIREERLDRMIMDRSFYVQKTELGDVKIKTVSGYGIKRQKPEYDDLRRIAIENDMSLSEVKSYLSERMPEGE